MTELVKTTTEEETSSESVEVGSIYESLVEAKASILSSLEHLIYNDEQMEKLTEATENLVANGVKFKQNTTKLRKHYWWEKYKVPILVGSGITVTGVVTTLVFVL